METEHQTQVKLVQWCKQNTDEHLELDLLFAIPNGGQRHIAVASKLKLEGVKAGVPDLFLPVSRKKYHGLFIEMKNEKGRLSSVQQDWRQKLIEQNYEYVVCKSCAQAQACILNYLKEEENE